MSALDSLSRGELDAALEQLKQEIRREPAEPKHRIFLFQLLAVTGQWDRALTQLNVLRDMDADAMSMVMTYQGALTCEALRSDVFRGKRSPLLFGEPNSWVALLIESLRLAAQEKHAEAIRLRDEAFDQAPAVGGTLRLRARGDQPLDEVTSEPFEWLADADSRLGPVLEAIVNGQYYWIPLERIAQIDIDAPTDLRDVVWLPAHFTWANQGTGVGLIPTRYCGSESSDDHRIRLARRTEWFEPAEGVYWGLGQRLFATDNGEYALLDIQQICLQPPAVE